MTRRDMSSLAVKGLIISEIPTLQEIAAADTDEDDEDEDEWKPESECFIVTKSDTPFSPARHHLHDKPFS